MAAQLLQLGAMYGEPQSSSAFVPPPPGLEAALHSIYSLLAAALDGPDADLVQMSLEREGTCWVWVGGAGDASGRAACRERLVPPECVAFSGEAGLAPYLFIVSTEFHKHHRYALPTHPSLSNPFL